MASARAMHACVGELECSQAPVYIQIVPENFPFDSGPQGKRCTQDADFANSLQLSSAVQHGIIAPRGHSGEATYTCVPALASVSAISGGAG